MKKVLIIPLFLLSLSVFSQEKVIQLDITGTDSFYIWQPFKGDGYSTIQVDFTDFSATDSCLIDFFYLFKDKTSGLYVPTRVEVATLPLQLKKATYQNVLKSAYLLDDTTNSVAIKVDGLNADGLGINITKYSTALEDSIVIRPRK